MTGTIYSVDGAGPLPCRIVDPGLLTIAKNDLTTGYGDAAGRVASTIATELGGVTLLDGVYNSASTTFEISAAQTLTLDGGGNADSVFIFKMGSTLTTFGSSKVVLTNGAQACNVFWQVGSSAVLGTGTTFVGTVMADQSITDNGGSTVNGRFLARIAAVTLNNTTISKPTCTSSSSGSTSSSLSAAGASSTYCAPLNDQIVSPTIIESKRIDRDSILISWAPYSGVDTFNVQYGTENGKWLYSTDVIGFSTTINALPLNQPIWVRVAARSDCTIGTYGQPKLVGGPSLPNTGFAPHKESTTGYVTVAIVVGAIALLVIIQRKYRCLLNR